MCYRFRLWVSLSNSPTFCVFPQEFMMCLCLKSTILRILNLGHSKIFILKHITNWNFTLCLSIETTDLGLRQWILCLQKYYFETFILNHCKFFTLKTSKHFYMKTFQIFLDPKTFILKYSKIFMLKHATNGNFSLCLCIETRDPGLISWILCLRNNDFEIFYLNH